MTRRYFTHHLIDDKKHHTEYITQQRTDCKARMEMFCQSMNCTDTQARYEAYIHQADLLYQGPVNNYEVIQDIIAPLSDDESIYIMREKNNYIELTDKAHIMAILRCLGNHIHKEMIRLYGHPVGVLHFVKKPPKGNNRYAIIL